MAIKCFVTQKLELTYTFTDRKRHLCNEKAILSPPCNKVYFFVMRLLCIAVHAPTDQLFQTVEIRSLAIFATPF